MYVKRERGLADFVRTSNMKFIKIRPAGFNWYERAFRPQLNAEVLVHAINAAPCFAVALTSVLVFPIAWNTLHAITSNTHT